MKELNKLYNQPCTCKTCHTCFATGKVDASDGSALEPCPDCGETGIISVCTRCLDIEHLLSAQDGIREAA